MQTSAPMLSFRELRSRAQILPKASCLLEGMPEAAGRTVRNSRHQNRFPTVPRQRREPRPADRANGLRFPTSLRIDDPRIHRRPVLEQVVHPHRHARALRVLRPESFPAPQVLQLIERIL